MDLGACLLLIGYTIAAKIGLCACTVDRLILQVGHHGICADVLTNSKDARTKRNATSYRITATT